MSSTEYNIKIGVDARSGERGVKSFSSALSDALRVLREFDKRSKSAFAGLESIAGSSTDNLAKRVRGTAQAINALNKVRISKALVNNLQMLQQALASFRFNAKALSKVPEALAALSRMKIDTSFVSSLNQIKAALVGFKGPPKAATDNLVRLAQGLAVVNPARIEAAAAALQKLNGFSFRAPRGGIQNITGNTRGLSALQSQIGSLSSSLGRLRTALTGVSTALLARGVYQTGNAFQTLQRTLGAVATSQNEVGDQMRFLTDLTTKMPVSLEAVAASFGKFAIAARLSGITAAQTQDTFSGFATAFSAMGVGAEAQKRGFEALIQMFSKGKIQAEEIRQQLAEALPGAMTLLAESMGVTTAQLSKMLEEGKVLATELPNMAALLQNRFAPSVEIAMQRASAQLTALSNEWTNLKRTIFDSGFESGLGALARSMTEALKTDVVRDFARDLGRGFATAATYTAAFAKTITSNATLLKTIFGGLAVVISAVLARSLLFVLGPAISLTVSAFKLLGKAALAAQARILAIPAGITLAAVALDQFANGGKATSAILDRLASAAKQVGNGLSDVLGNLTGDALDGLGDNFAKNLKEAQDYAARIQNSPLFDPTAIARNAELEAANSAKKLAALTETEQSVWEEVNAIGKSNSEYVEQLRLLDAIAAKKGIDAAPWKAALAAQTLGQRNPAGALASALGEELATLRAKTGEQKALNAAQRDYNDLLAKGQNIGKEGLDALRQYHTVIARLNGEIGNGFERWTATVGDFNDRMQDAVKSGIEGLSDEITNFVTGAETDFAGLARSILRTFVKISLDSLLKDLFGAMGMDPAKSATSSAEAALAKLAGIGENITTAMTNVYTTGLSINGLPVGAGSFAASPELPGNRERLRRLEESFAPTSGITRSALPDIPGTDVAGRLSDANVRFPIESAVGGLRGSYGPAGAFAVTAENLNLRGSLPVNVTIPAATASVGQRLASGNPFLDLIGRAEGTDRGRGYNETLAYGAFTGGNRNLTGMTLDQIDALQGQMLRHPENTFNSSALGRYQITQRTMRGLRSQMGLTGDELFDPAMQDSMALRLMERRGNNVAGLRNEWEGLRRVEPATIQNTYSASSLDPSVTGSIDALNAKLHTVSTTAAQTAPAFDSLRAANQNMATASTMAGTNVATAGTMAGAAGPQFTTAGQSIATAGQNAATAGMQAQTATSGLGGFGQGISGLLGPLASAIPGLGQFGGAIMSLASSLFSGGGMGGGLLGGLFSEGGYASSPVARAALPISAWAHAPHFAEGTPNTSGGIPAVLHDNEAVVPLSRGRSIPVEMPEEKAPMYGEGAGGRRGNTTNHFHLHGVKDADSFRRSKTQVQSQLLSAQRRALLRNG